MKIKLKLYLGLGGFFFMIILLGIVGASYINALKVDTENILVANYHTLEYTKNMLSALEDKKLVKMVQFERNLQRQEKNISELGEKEITNILRNHFNEFKKNPTDSNLVSLIRKNIYQIMEINMQAIQRKSEQAKDTANTAMFWVILTFTLSFLISFVLLLNLPSNIASPIQELTESIKEIAAQKYFKRVYFTKNDEFGELATSFNTMASKLEEYNNSNLAEILKDKQRIEVLINNMTDPVIGLDEDLKVIFVNQEAIKVIGLEHNTLIGQSATKIALNNDLVRLLIRDLLENISKDTQISTKNIQTPLKIYANEKESYFEKEILHIMATPTGENISNLIGHVIILRNITSYKELDFAKTNFIATISHEFKTPLAAIKMSLQLLENKKVGNLNKERKI